MRWWFTLSLLALSAVVAAQNGAVVASVFHIGKSQNRNQVHYGIHLDRECRPAGPSPVYAYWRDLEISPTATEPLSSGAERVYGIAEQAVRGNQVNVTLRSLDRPVSITTSTGEGGCRAVATMTIRGQEAMLDEAFVQLRGLGLRIRYVELRGTVDGRAITERVTP